MRGWGCGWWPGCLGDCRCAGSCPRRVLRWWQVRGEMSVLTDYCLSHRPTCSQQWMRMFDCPGCGMTCRPSGGRTLRFVRYWSSCAGQLRRRDLGCRNWTEGPEPLPAAAPPALSCGCLSDICRRIPPVPPVSGRPARRPRWRRVSGPYSSSCCPCLPT